MTIRVITPNPYIQGIHNDIENEGITYKMTLEPFGEGGHGRVFAIKEAEMIFKQFKREALAGKYLDYIYLEKLQGIGCVPTLYAYEENKWMIAEKVGGIKLGDYIAKHKRYPLKFKSLIEYYVKEFAQRNLLIVDIKPSEHIFWDDEKENFKFIDFGVCDDISHMTEEFKEQAIEGMLQNIYKELEAITIMS
jgi:hypothetical protein